MKRIKFFFYLFALITLSNCVSQREVVRCAINKKGKPCMTNGIGPDTFDSPGLAYYCHNKEIPRNLIDQSIGEGKTISKSELKPGDLMFWKTDGNGISITSIYIGNGRMIYASKPGYSVKETASSSSYWDSKFVYAKRYWK